MKRSIFKSGRNVWRIEKASHAAVLIDGAAFFGAVREACLNARHSILIVGWDIDSRVRLVGEREPDDGYSAVLSDFLTELVRTRPDLHVELLLWDYSLLYANEREPFPRLSLQWQTPERITLCLDNIVPLGCSQHQKIIVVDDAVAFSGGLDLTIRRWDTPDHRADNSDRTDPSGEPYRPFHDVQMMVDGDAAKALAQLARERWCRANGGEPCVSPSGDPWPQSIKPDFTDVDIAISRTLPENGSDEVREVEALFLDSIDAAERSVYIENQYLTAPVIADRLAKQLRRKRELEVLIVAPKSHDSWFESHGMRNGRIRFLQKLRRAGGDRVRLLYPSVHHGEQSTDTMIHSKIMVVDDRFLRVGSANLNNRSMGADTECDLAIDARNATQRAAVAAVRNRLLGEHCGVDEHAVAAALRRNPSLIAAAETLAANGHRLLPIEDGAPDDSEITRLTEEVADPNYPPEFRKIGQRLLSRLSFMPSAIPWPVIVGASVALALTLAWYLTPLSDIAAPDRVQRLLAGSTGQFWAPAVVMAVFVIGGLVAFPLTILIVATAATFGPWLGMLYAMTGAILSASVMHFIGAQFGHAALSRMLGPRWDGVRGKLAKRGILTVVAVRIVPIAPYTLVNLAAGASSITLRDFIIGTFIGLAPGLVAMSFFGSTIVNVLTAPSAADIAILTLSVVAWLALAFGAQATVSRYWNRAS